MSSINKEEIYKSIYGNENLSSEDIMEISNVIQLISIWISDNPGGVVDYSTIKVTNEGVSKLQFVYTQSVNNSPKKYKVSLYLVDDIRYRVCDKSSIGYIKCDEIDDAPMYDINKLSREDMISILKSINYVIDQYMNHTTHFDDEGFWDNHK